jgi:hypothetical protein
MLRRLHAVLEARLAGLGLSPPALLTRDAPIPLARPGLASANRACRLVRAADGWVALTLARPEDREALPALIGAQTASPGAVRRWAARQPKAAVRDRAITLQMPVAVLGETPPQELAMPVMAWVPEAVVDLSALWAGPLCAGLLARAGSDVVRVESIGRPDPTPVSSPKLDQLINGAKRRVRLDLRSSDDRARLLDLIAAADVVVTSARPAALARLGLAPERFARPAWVALTAHGSGAGAAERVGFGDDCAVAGGLVRWRGGMPRFLGDALADPLTGLEAARRVLAGERGLIGPSLAGVSAAYARLLR